MVERIVGRELVGLFFVRRCLFESAEGLLGASQFTIRQGQSRIALHGIAPNRNGFLLAAQLPERFAFFLARENQIFSLALTLGPGSLLPVL